MRNKGNIAILIVAGGVGRRAGGDLPKQYQYIGDKAVIQRTVEAFVDSGGPYFKIYVVIHSEHRELFLQLCGGYIESGVIAGYCIGGESRQESVYNGLRYIKENSANTTPDYVLVHDAARPFVTYDLIDRVVGRVASGDVVGVVPVMPIVETVKRVDKDGYIVATEDRESLVVAQTPQAFMFEELLEAHSKAYMKGYNGYTDDASILEGVAAGMGKKLVTILGQSDNIKLTTREDMSLYRAGIGTGIGVKSDG